MPKNPIKQFDDLILEHKWLAARTLLLSLGPLQAAHTVLAAMVWFDRCADERDWELFNENLAGLYPSEDIPEWCQMPEDEHQAAGGCWGILHGEIASKGRDHCGDCEYHLKPDETISHE